MDMTRFIPVGEWDGKAERKVPDVVARRLKVLKRKVTKISGLYREELLGERYACHTLYQVRKEEWWKNIVVRFDLIC